MAVTHPDPEPTASSAWADPPLECDVVMKGGITSGVVYPGAVVRLAKRYRFRSIGGTSAGALAAAASAAAEHGRGRGGFEKLAQVPGQLGGSANGDPFILTLFPPEASTKPLFNAAISFQRGGIAGGIRATLKAFPRFPLIAAALVAVALVLGLTEAVPWAVAVALISIAPWLLVVGLGRDLFTAFTRLAKNDFGLCRLGPASGQPNALTLWLHNLVQDLAGRNPGEAVLTFADLWGLEPLHGNETPDHLAARDKRRALLASTPAERAIDLQMITTNLTVGRPLRLPMQRDRWRESYDDGGLLFDPNEWAQYVPQDVLDHMTKVAEHPKDDAAAVLAAQAAGRTLLYFPGSADLPVVVAARMSLSFPVLISTVPLWQIQYRDDGNHQLRRMVFSDGGISSNFPVHMFDSPLPTRPTFALNLTGFEPDDQADLNDPADCVRDPAPPTGRASETWNDPRTMFGFVVSIKDALENWRDNAQARMPGFRERIIHIKLSSGEGGLNLAMDQQKVERLIKRGDYAAQRLAELFSGPDRQPPQPTPQWNDHRYARFRTLMSSLERLLTKLHTSYTTPPDPTTIPYPTRINQGTTAPYPLTPDQLTAAIQTLDSYLAIATTITETLDDRNVPHPKAITRITPPV